MVVDRGTPDDDGLDAIRICGRDVDAIADVRRVVRAEVQRVGGAESGVVLFVRTVEKQLQAGQPLRAWSSAT